MALRKPHFEGCTCAACSAGARRQVPRPVEPPPLPPRARPSTRSPGDSFGDERALLADMMPDDGWENCRDGGNVMKGGDRMTQVQGQIAAECDAVKALLLRKNAAYGNSALDPVRVFSRADSEEQIRVRLDDKLSRLARGSADGEDVELDILGYLVLLRVARANRK